MRRTGALFFDPDDPGIRDKLERLQPVTGFCILVDIVESTLMKDGPLMDWARRMHNAFAGTLSFLSQSIRPLKCIGDQLMFFVPNQCLKDTTPLDIFSGLCSRARETDSLFRDVKIALAYCENVYPITFIRDTQDFYGRDLDLTTRLLCLARPREIVMNEPFVIRVRTEYEGIGNGDQFPEVGQIVGPVATQLRGFDRPVNVYRLPDTASAQLDSCNHPKV